MEVVRAALDLRVDGRSARETLLRIEAARDDVDGIERLERRHVGRDVRQPDVGRADPVDADVVGAAARAVDVEDERARRIRGYRVRLRGRREAREHAEEVLVVTVERHRQIHELVRLQLGSHLGAIGLQQRAFRRHRHRLAELAHLQRHVDARDAVERDRDILPCERPEALELHRYRVGARLHSREAIRAHRIADRLARLAALVMDDGDRRARKGPAGLVDDVADDRAIQHLTDRRRCKCAECYG